MTSVDTVGGDEFDPLAVSFLRGEKAEVVLDGVIGERWPRQMEPILFPPSTQPNFCVELT